MLEKDMDSIRYQVQAQRCYELASILNVLAIILERYENTKQLTKNQQTKELILDLFHRIPIPGTNKAVEPTQFSSALKTFYQGYRAAVNEEGNENEDSRVLYEFLDKLEKEISRFDTRIQDKTREGRDLAQ